MAFDYTDPSSYQRAYKEALEWQGEQKLQSLLALHRNIQTFEKLAASDFSIPFDTIKSVRAYIPDVESGINRLQAAKKNKNKETT